MKAKLLVIAGLGLLLGAFFVPGVARAASNMRSGNVATIAKDETVDASAYVAGSTVKVDGTVKGDLYCAGQTVDITGTVEGDVICAGQIVNISGTVNGNVRVAGQTVTLNSSIGRSLSAFGQNVTVSAQTTVAADATLFGSVTQVNGKISRDLVAGGQTVTLLGTVGRSATMDGENLSLANGSRIGGDFEYTSHDKAHMATGSVIGGHTQRHEASTQQHRETNPFIAAVWGIAFWFGAMLFVSLVLLGLFPRTYAAVQREMAGRGWLAVLAGAGALVLTPIVAFVLMVTVLGIPLAIILLLAWGIALLTSFGYAGYGLGLWIIERAKWNVKWRSVSALLLGLFVLAVLMLIPLVGFLSSFVAFIWGIGALILAATNSSRTRKAAKT